MRQSNAVILFSYYEWFVSFPFWREPKNQTKPNQIILFHMLSVYFYVFLSFAFIFFFLRSSLFFFGLPLNVEHNTIPIWTPDDGVTQPNQKQKWNFTKRKKKQNNKPME